MMNLLRVVLALAMTVVGLMAAVAAFGAGLSIVSMLPVIGALGVAALLMPNFK